MLDSARKQKILLLTLKRSLAMKYTLAPRQQIGTIFYLGNWNSILVVFGPHGSDLALVHKAS